MNPENYDSQQRIVELSAKNPTVNPNLEDLLNTPLPDYDQGVESMATKRREELDTQHGRYWERLVTMSDGHQHTELIGLSNLPDANELVVSIPAWWTRLDGGLNKLTSDHFHEQGRHTLTKGVTENRMAALSRGAHDLHASLDHNNQGLEYYFDASNILVHGDSNGAMQGTGILVYAEEHNRDVSDAFLVDPCIVHKIGRLDVQKFIDHPSYLPKEILTIARHIIKTVQHPELEISEFAKTIESNPKRLLGNVMLTQALFSGEFGLLLANLPAEQRVHFVLFNHSLANQKTRMLQILDTSPANTTSEIRPGTHTSIADPQVIKDKVNYLTSERQLSLIT